MAIVNLTPHRVTIGGHDFPPSGEVARVNEDAVYFDGVQDGGVEIPRAVVVTGRVSGLPDPEDGTIYIVSRMVVEAEKLRTDLYFPFGLKRDSEGNIIGARSLGCLSLPTAARVCQCGDCQVLVRRPPVEHQVLALEEQGYSHREAQDAFGLVLDYADEGSSRMPEADPAFEPPGNPV